MLLFSPYGPLSSSLIPRTHGLGSNLRLPCYADEVQPKIRANQRPILVHFGADVLSAAALRPLLLSHTSTAGVWHVRMDGHPRHRLPCRWRVYGKIKVLKQTTCDARFSALHQSTDSQSWGCLLRLSDSYQCCP